MARFLNVRRIIEANDNTLLGANGEYSDFQYIQEMLEELAYVLFRLCFNLCKFFNWSV